MVINSSYTSHMDTLKVIRNQTSKGHGALPKNLPRGLRVSIASCPMPIFRHLPCLPWFNAKHNHEAGKAIKQSLKGGEITTWINSKPTGCGDRQELHSFGHTPACSCGRKRETGRGFPASPLGDLISMISILLKKFNPQVYLVKNSIHG